MKKLFYVLGTSVLFACNDTAKDGVNSAGGTVKDSTTAVDNTTYPYTASYSSKFEMGSTKDAEHVLAFWKDFDNGTIANSRDILADSVTVMFSDGTTFSGPRDSAVKDAQSYRDMFASVTSNVEAWIPLRATDKNENWVGIWGWEKHTGKDGKIDSVHLHEIWRMNSAGKADFIMQFTAKQPPAKK
ncbi:MAG TPA: hypothetical protein VJT83_06105 [Chitinophagaceae bacterium]|nr:hypothetical protein [Chitinophagaceae bacterium]